MRKQQTFRLEEKILNQLRQKAVELSITCKRKVTQSEILETALAKLGIK